MQAFVFANVIVLIANGVYTVRVALWKMEQFSIFTSEF